jgi:hypothetical protein
VKRQSLQLSVRFVLQHKSTTWDEECKGVQSLIMYELIQRHATAISLRCKRGSRFKLRYHILKFPACHTLLRLEVCVASLPMAHIRLTPDPKPPYTFCSVALCIQILPDRARPKVPHGGSKATQAFTCAAAMCVKSIGRAFIASQSTAPDRSPVGWYCAAMRLSMSGSLARTTILPSDGRMRSTRWHRREDYR